MSIVRWGIVGAGRIAHQFSQDMAVSSNARLIAVAARDGARAREFADQYGAPHAHAGYQALYNNPEVDAVYVATPHSHHLQNCVDAMAAGKAVLCEKPLVLNPQECQQLMSAHQAHGQYLMEGMWTWFLPAIRKAQAWVAEGRIGDLLHVKADFGYPLQYSETLREYDSKMGGGSTLEMGVYTNAIARLFIGGEYHDLKVTAQLAPNGVEDNVSAIYDYGHAMATIGSSFRCRLRNSAFIIGTEGYIEIPDFFRAFECSLYHLDTRVEHFEDGRKSIGFNYEIEAVCEDILAGLKESPVIPLATSLKIQQDMAAIKQAAGQSR